jgi:hypothetical protein
MSNKGDEKEEGDDVGPKLVREIRANAIVPDWLKFSAAVIAGTISAMLFMQREFVSRAEYSNHVTTKERELTRMADLQEHYATAERLTSESLVEIRADVGWLRAYLDVTKPPPRTNGKKP